ncbi:MAG: Crp/Fnr family transcriptional regulator [Streptosporangiaceae bacterium]
MTDGGRPCAPGSLLAGLPGGSRQRLPGLGPERQYPRAGRVLINEGSRSTAVYLLFAGSVKVTGATDAGDALLAIRVDGDLVGELVALDGRPRLATVTIAGPVTARVIGHSESVALLSRDPGLARAVARSVSDKLRSATSPRIDLTGCDATTRLARVLSDLATRCGQQTPAGQTICGPLTQTEPATPAGLAEPTVWRTLRQFKADDIIATGCRETTVLDIAALRKRAASDDRPEANTKCNTQSRRRTGCAARCNPRMARRGGQYGLPAGASPWGSTGHPSSLRGCGHRVPQLTLRPRPD